MLVEGGFILLERLEFFSLEQHLLGCRLPVSWQGLEHRQPAFPPIEDEQHDGRDNPHRTDDARVVVRKEHHHEEEEDAEEAEHTEDGKPDLVAAVGHPDVERHLVWPRREGVLEAQDEEGNEHQQIAGGGTESVEIGENVDRGGLAHGPRCEESEDRLQEGDYPEHDYGPRRCSETLVDLGEPVWKEIELAHRVAEA